MIRSIAVLVSAILMSRPGMPKTEATRYARVLNDVAAEYGFDPLLAVSIVHFETRWRPNLISADGEDYGLGQVRARYVSACRGDADPLNAPSPACSAAKQALLSGEVNIRRMGQIIGANRGFCAHLGRPKTHNWLAGYQGYGSADPSRWCKPGPKTWQVLGYHKDLVAKLDPPKKPKASKKRGDPGPVAHAAEPKSDASKVAGEATPARATSKAEPRKAVKKAQPRKAVKKAQPRRARKRG